MTYKFLWKRIRPGAYISVGLMQGYEVGKAVSEEWYYEGPGLDDVADTKSKAQAACQQHQNRRATP